MVTSSVCVAENLAIRQSDGALQMAPWSVPRNVVDQMVKSNADGQLLSTQTLPGKLMMDHQFNWLNDSPVDHTILIRVTRRWKETLTSNPNAIQYRDRWAWGLNVVPTVPVVTSTFNGQVNLAGDVGTNTVAEPNPGKFYGWWGTNTSEEWVGLPITPGDQINLWYQAYVWTPPPWSDNANKNAPEHTAAAGWSRVQMIAFPQQGATVIG